MIPLIHTYIPCMGDQDPADGWVGEWGIIQLPHQCSLHRHLLFWWYYRVDPSWIRSPKSTPSKAAARGAGSAAAGPPASESEEGNLVPERIPPGRVTEAPASPADSGSDGVSSATPLISHPRDDGGGGRRQRQQNGIAEEATAAGLPEEGGEAVYAHQGALRSAQAIVADLERTGVLRAVLDGDEAARRRLGHSVYRQVRGGGGLYCQTGWGQAVTKTKRHGGSSQAGGMMGERGMQLYTLSISPSSYVPIPPFWPLFYVGFPLLVVRSAS